MIEWHKPADKLPEYNQECLLMGRNDTTAGPIMWKGSAWMDIFGTPEAGVAYTPEIVMLWTDWDAIKPPDELVEACENAAAQ